MLRSPVIITLIKHWKEDKILLGRNRSWPAGFYSCLAGFCESVFRLSFSTFANMECRGGESLEEATAREIYEESGIRVKDVKYHSSQPWPYPASLMFGTVCTAEEGEIRTDLGQSSLHATQHDLNTTTTDNELESARWVSREYVQDALKLRTTLSRHETSKFDMTEDGKPKAKAADLPDVS